MLIWNWLPKRLLLLNGDWLLLLCWACWLLDRKLLTDRLRRLLKLGGYWLPELLGESWLLLPEWLLGYLLLSIYISKIIYIEKKNTFN